MLSLITFLPLVGVLLCALVPRSNTSLPKKIALVISLIDLALVVYVVALFDPHALGFQFVERLPWISQLGISYTMAVDGISITMLVLSALITVIAVLAAYKISDRPNFFFAMLMLLQVGMNGVFLACDFILFYLFWELVLIPMYFLIGQWGGPRRSYAALKFFLYTFFGSVFMLVGIIIMALQLGSFDMMELSIRGRELSLGLQTLLFILFFLGFGVKVPIWPLHTWLPDAHVEAPTAVSAILAGVLLKMGLYGFLRVSLPMLPAAFDKLKVFLAILALISIIYGALAAFAQDDMKKLVAYSSVSHMGFAMMGVAAGTTMGINAALAVGFSHGLISAMLFLVVGMIYDRAHTRDMNVLSGVWEKTPVIGGLMVFASVAAVGVPGMSGFVGEFLALVGAYKSELPSIIVVLALLGVLLGAVYMLTLLRRVVYGKTSEVYAHAPEACVREVVMVAVLIIMIVAIGVHWDLLIHYFDPAAQTLELLLEV